MNSHPEVYLFIFPREIHLLSQALTRLPHAGKIRDWVNEKEERNVKSKIFITFVRSFHNLFLFVVSLIQRVEVEFGAEKHDQGLEYPKHGSREPTLSPNQDSLILSERFTTKSSFIGNSYFTFHFKTRGEFVIFHH